MKKFTTLLLAILMVLPLMAATPEKLYFTPSSGWKSDNARFAAYFFGNGEKWVSMTQNADVDGMYEVDAPAGYPKVIFCRMNPSAAANNWNNKWNQSGDLTIPTDGKNHFTMPNNSWDNFTTTWGTYTPPTPTAPTLSNFKATPAEVNPGELVTFSCDIANGDEANIYYTVDGEKLAGDTWTATDVKGAHIATANYEGADSKQLTVTVMGEPTVEKGQVIAFFDNSTAGWTTVNAHVWAEGGNGTSWPGEACTYIGNNIWQWVGTGDWATTYPEKIIFNNGSGAQTANLLFANGGVYTKDMAALSTPNNVILPDGVVELVVPAVAYTDEEVELNVFYDEEIFAGYTLSFTINGVEQSEDTWTPTAVGTYTIVAVLTKGETVKTSDPVEVTVKQSTHFTVYLQKPEGWNDANLYYWTPGGCPSFPGIAMEEVVVVGEYYYSYTFKNIESADFVFVQMEGGAKKSQTVDIPGVKADTYYKLGDKNNEGKYTVEVLPTPEPYAETIVAGYYYLQPGAWAVDNAWYAVYFYNRNKAENNYQWVQGYVTESGLVVFTYAGEEKYTHMIFCRMDPAFLNEQFVGEMQWGNEWNKTEGIEYGEKPAFSVCIINGWEENSYEWGVLENPTAVEGVEATNGIAYANGIVAAEGAIEVYNVNGMVVARGNESLDLRNLNAGVYIVRNGNNVRKVVR